MDTLKGKQIMVWTFMGNTRMYQALRDYGDRISQIGLFSFKVRATGEIYKSGVSIAAGSTMRTYISKWPHIKWLLTVANDGTNSIFKALREKTGGAQDVFLSELVRIMEKYPWCDGMAWAGSAPGPVSPRSWLEGIYDYAVKVMNPDKVFLEMPAYGWNWRIHDTPKNMGVTYRGTSNTYYAAQLWMTGGYYFTDDKPPQPFIPIVAYWDDYDKVPWALPHVYDYMEGRDAVSYDYPLLSGTYNRRHYLTAYGKEQKTEFGNIIVDRSGGSPDSYSGIVSVSEGMVTMGDTGSATYRFSVPSAGTYDVAVRLCLVRKRNEMKMDREDIYEMMIREMRETAVRERNEHSPEYQELLDKVARLNKEMQER